MKKIILPLILVVLASFVYADSLNLNSSHILNDAYTSHSSPSYDWFNNNPQFLRVSFNPSLNTGTRYDALDYYQNGTRFALDYAWYQEPLNITNLILDIEDCLSATTVTAKIYNNVWVEIDSGTTTPCVSGTTHTVNYTGGYQIPNGTSFFIGVETDSNVTVAVDSTSEQWDYLIYYGGQWNIFNNIAIKNWASSDESRNTTSYIQFNISELPSDIAISEILLGVTASRGGADDNVSVYKCSGDSWNETSVLPTSLTFDSDSLDSLLITGAGSFVYNLTDTVIGSDEDNLTYCLYSPVTGSMVEFRSKEYSTEADRPFLNITYGDAPASNDITNCSALTSSGLYYLTNDIVDSTNSSCMNITATDVVLDCQGNTIDGDDTADYGIRIELDDIQYTNVTVKNCTVKDWDTTGIRVKHSSFVFLDNLTVYSNPNEGIEFRCSQNNTLTNSYIYDNGEYDLDLGGNPFDDNCPTTEIEWYCNHTFSGNTWSGDRNFGYYKNGAYSISDLTFSQLILCNVENTTLSNLIINGSDTEENNGLFIFHGKNITGITITSDFNHVGIEGYPLNDSTFTGINARSNKQTNDLYGIVLGNSFNNVFTASAISGYTNLISLSSSNSNSFYYNTLEDAKSFVFQILSSSSNNIYNNLINDTAYIQYFSGSNNWNTSNQTGTRIHSSGTNIGGNYWSNSTGGYSDICTDSDTDGFCDTAFYLEDSNEYDYLPLSDEYVSPTTDSEVDLFAGPNRTTERYLYFIMILIFAVGMLAGIQSGILPVWAGAIGMTIAAVIFASIL